MSELEQLIQNLPTKTGKEKSKKIQAIEKEFKKMDENYFKKIINKMEMHSKAFDMNKTFFNEYLSEGLQLEYKIAELKYNGYKRILEDESKINEITQEVNGKISKLKEIRNIIYGTAIEFQRQAQQNLSAMKKSGLTEEEIRNKIPSVIFYTDEEFKNLIKSYELED